MSTHRPSLLARAAHRIATALRPPGTGIATPSLADTSGSLIFQPVSPERARWILEAAVTGDLQQQHELFGLMLDSWPRAAKAASEVTSAVRRRSWQVSSPADHPLREEWVDITRSALRGWRPRTGTFELTLEDTLEALLDARLRGVSVIELQWQYAPCGLVPRAGWQLSPGAHWGWDRTGTELGLCRGDWRPFVPGQHLCGIWRARPGAPGATAMLRPLVPYWVGRTYGWQWLLRTAQIFGMPFRWATYDASRPDVGAQLAQMLGNLAQAGWGAFPAGTQIDFKDALNSARDNPQVLLHEMADQACDLLLLGQTLSGTSQAAGLGSGTADLHGQVRREVIDQAAGWVADVLNYQLVPALIEANYGAITDPALLPVIAPDLSIPADPKAEAERLEILKRVGLRIPAKWAHETTGIPEPEEDETVLESPTPENFGFNGGFSPNPSQPPLDPSNRVLPHRAAPRGGSGEGDAVESSRREPLRAAQAAPSPVVARLFEDLTGVTRDWLGPVEARLQALVQMAEDGQIPDAQFAGALQELQRELPELFDELDTDRLADALRRAMAAEMVNGASEAPPLRTAFNPNQARQSNGQFDGPGAGWSEGRLKQEQARGERSMTHILDSHEDVLNAMEHPDLGDIDFRWGDEQKGIRHIMNRAQQRQARFKDGITAEEILYKIPEVILRGKIRQIGDKSEIRYTTAEGEWLAVLGRRNGKKPSQNAWLLTGYDINEAKK